MNHMWKEFKEFAIKGNAIDLAVGVIIGAAFGDGRFILLTAFTTRKMQSATMAKLITRVIKLP